MYEVSNAKTDDSKSLPLPRCVYPGGQANISSLRKQESLSSSWIVDIKGTGVSIANMLPNVILAFNTW